MSFARVRIRVVLLCGLAAALLPLPALAASPKPQPCWVLLLNESYSGHITTIYPQHCYTQALQHIPAIATIYGNEKEQIQQAAAAAARGTLPPGGSSGPPTAATTVNHGWFWKAIHKFDPGSANAFPTPLIVLGALAVLLVIAGIAGMLWQRSHPRESGPPAAT
jgi:hypothetical protein